MPQKYKESKPMIISYGIAQRYKKALERLCRDMVVSTYKALREEFKSNSKTGVAMDGVVDNYTQLINDKRREYGFIQGDIGYLAILRMIEETFRDAYRSSNRAINELSEGEQSFMRPNENEEEYGAYIPPSKISMANLFTSLKASSLTAKEKQIMEAVLRENQTLIQNVFNNFFDDAIGASMRAIQFDDSVKELAKDLQLAGQRAISRIERIADDQAHKAFVGFVLPVVKESQITKFKWVHTYNGKYPRKYHRDVLNGKIFDINNPPVIDPKTGETGYGGQLPYCRCVMVLIKD